MGGLIFHGVDTIYAPRECGFDFVTQVPCTNFVDVSPYACVNHIKFYIDPLHNLYNFTVPLGYCLNMHKINLDSISSAPPDSVLYKQTLSFIDNIPVDSLSSRLGNVYILKTAVDPRQGYGYPLYAKIKLLKFIVVDSASHSVKMAFLWAYNDAGSHDLHTAGLDTFQLDSVPTNTRNAQFSTYHAGAQYLFRIVGDRFIVPKDFSSAEFKLVVFDVRGKEIGRVALNGRRIINLREYVNGFGVFVVGVILSKN